jgi:hypothetical protein
MSPHGLSDVCVQLAPLVLGDDPLHDLRVLWPVVRWRSRLPSSVEVIMSAPASGTRPRTGRMARRNRLASFRCRSNLNGRLG